MLPAMFRNPLWLLPAALMLTFGCGKKDPTRPEETYRPPGTTIFSAKDLSWDATWSPDGSRIAFASSAGSFYEVQVAPSGGGPTRKLETNYEVGVSSYSPRWSPDGTRIAFVRSLPAYGSICVTPAAGGAVTELNRGDRPFVKDPQWSPDGTQMVYLASTENYYWLESEVWVAPVSGGPARRLTPTPSHYWNVRWSPDGSKVLAVSTTGLFAIDPTSLGTVRLMDFAPLGTMDIPTISADWSTMACSISNNGASTREVYVAPVAGGSPLQITHGGAQLGYWTPLFSPNGTRLLFTGGYLHQNETNSLNGDLFLSPAAGGALVNLTKSVGDPSCQCHYEFTPVSWSPDGRKVLYISCIGLVCTQHLLVLDVPS